MSLSWNPRLESSTPRERVRTAAPEAARARFDGWLLAACLLANIYGCAKSDVVTDECESGVRRLTSCGQKVEQTGEIDCSGDVECALGCANDAPNCQDLNSPDGGYAACVNGCYAK